MESSLDAIIQDAMSLTGGIEDNIKVIVAKVRIALKLHRTRLTRTARLRKMSGARMPP
jgi:hypothetical protein